jgi:hypothetical protein
MPLDHILPFVRETARFPFYRDLIAAGSFPRGFADLRPIQNVLAIRTLERELVWGASILKLFTNELSRFIELEKQFYNVRIRGDLDQASAILETVEQQLGISIWLIEHTIQLSCYPVRAGRAPLI